MLAYLSNFAQMMPAALSPDLALRLATNSMISSEPAMQDMYFTLQI